MTEPTRSSSLGDTVSVLVTDLDNTLFYPGTERLPPELPEGLRRWRREGGHWIIATGRPTDHMTRFFEQWGITPDFFVARERYIFDTRSHTGDESYREWNRAMEERTEHVENTPAVWMSDLRAWLREQPFEAELYDIGAKFESPEHAIIAETVLGEILPDDRKPIRNRQYLGVVPREIGKGRCLEQIVGRMGWDERHLLTVGDSGNDRDMLDGRYEYISVTVENADDEIKSLVREHGGTVWDAGGGTAVIEILDHLLRD